MSNQDIPIYTGSFRKKDETIRKMTFAYKSDLPEEFLKGNVKGVRNVELPTGMKRVWDIEADAFRTFNEATATDSPVQTAYGHVGDDDTIQLIS